MSTRVIRRNVYFNPVDGEYNHTSTNHYEDLTQFHMPLAAVHHSSLHGWGIVEGLGVSGSLGTATVVVAPGVAVDQEGRLIVLATCGDIGTNPPGDQHQEETTPVQLRTDAYHNAVLYLTIQYSEILRTASGAGGQLELVPWLRLLPTSGVSLSALENGTELVLAIVVTDAQGQLKELKASDPTLPHARRQIITGMGELQLRRAVAGSDGVAGTMAGTIGPAAAGGLQVSTPATQDVGSPRRTLTVQGSPGVLAIAVHGAPKADAELGRLDFGSDYLGGQVQYPARIVAVSETNAYSDAGLNQAVSGQLQFQTLAVGGNLGNDGAKPSTKLTITGSGNVGIGTNNPQAQLSISEPNTAELKGKAHSPTLRVTAPQLAKQKGSEIALASFGCRVGNNLALGIRALRTADSDNWFQSTAIGLGMDVDDAVRAGANLWLHANGNIGIGTSDPQRRLHVQGGRLRVSESDSVGGSAVIELTNSTKTNFVFTDGQSGNLHLRTDSTTHHVVLQEGGTQGNVGIGTADPKAKLDVRGAIYAGGSALYFTESDHKHSGIGNTNGYAAIENAADAGALMILGRAGTPQGRTVKLWDYLLVNGSLDVTGNITTAGKLTVTAPSNLKGGATIDSGLTVAGNIAVSGTIGTRGHHPLQGLPGGWGGGLHTWDVYAEATIAAGRNGQVKAYFNSEGSAFFARIGIGTSTPNAELDVVGKVQAKAFVGDGVVPKGAIVMWSGQVDQTPVGWTICNGQNGTPDLRDRFIVAAGGAYAAKQSGEPDQHGHAISVPALNLSTNVAGEHYHLLPPGWYARNFDDGKYTGIDVGGWQFQEQLNNHTARVESAGQHAHGLTVPTQNLTSAQSSGLNRPKWYALCFIMKV